LLGQVDVFEFVEMAHDRLARVARSPGALRLPGLRITRCGSPIRERGLRPERPDRGDPLRPVPSRGFMVSWPESANREQRQVDLLAQADETVPADRGFSGVAGGVGHVADDGEVAARYFGGPNLLHVVA